MGPSSRIEQVRAVGRTFCQIFTVSLGGDNPTNGDCTEADTAGGAIVREPAARPNGCQIDGSRLARPVQAEPAEAPPCGRCCGRGQPEEIWLATTDRGRYEKRDRGRSHAARRGHSRHSAALRSTTRSRSDRIVAMWASWPTTRSIPTTRPSIRALSPTTWRSWLALYRPTGDGRRSLRTSPRHRGATVHYSRRSASWRWAAPMRAC